MNEPVREIVCEFSGGPEDGLLRLYRIDPARALFIHRFWPDRVTLEWDEAARCYVRVSASVVGGS